MTEDKSITKWFGDNLAKLLADKINTVYKDFNSEEYVKIIKKECKEPRSLSDLVTNSIPFFL